MGTGALGLTIGYGLGYVMRLLLFLVALPVRDRASVKAARLPQIRQLVDVVDLSDVFDCVEPFTRSHSVRAYDNSGRFIWSRRCGWL